MKASAFKLILTFVSFLVVQNGFAAVVANIGSKPLSAEDVRDEYYQINSEQKKSINKDPVARRQLVENVINTEVLVQAAKGSGLESDQEYKKAMERFKRQYLASKYIEKKLESKLDRGDLKKYFNANKKIFDSSQVCAYHIVMNDLKEAEKIAKLAKQKGTKFEELAKKHSIDPTVQENKGNLQCFTRDQMVPQFSEAAFSMKKGEIRGPVASPYGFHVIKVYDTKPGKAPNFEEVEQRVKDTYRIKLIQDLIAELRQKSNVKINEEEVKKFSL